MSAKRPATRYTSVAIILHWAIALLVIGMVPMGWWMVDAINDPASQKTAYQVFQLHKSIGFAILALTLVRVIWRLTHPVPALPQGMRWWEIFLAHATHIGFYGLLIALPLTGWIYVSTGWAVSTDRPLGVATSWFGLFTVPHLPGVEGSRAAAFGAMGAHSLLAWGGIVLVVLHAGAALKHQFIERDGVLAQMVPFLRGHADKHATQAVKATSGGLSGNLAVGAGLAVVAAIAVAGWSMNQPAPLAPSAALAQPATVAQSTPPAAAEAASPAAPPSSAALGTAQAWTIDRAASHIAFSGTHTGSPFEGRFDTWTGTIRFDPDDLAGSAVSVAIDTGSARTGDTTQETSLSTDEWLGTDKFPQARFEAATFRALGDNRFEAEGTLTIKDKAFPIILPFSLTINGNVADVDGTVELDRTAMDLGMFSDPTADWVSKLITVRIAVRATRT